jgi:hypothetical protein
MTATKVNELFLKIAGTLIVLLLGVIGYYQKSNNDQQKEINDTLNKEIILTATDRESNIGFQKMCEFRFSDVNNEIAIIKDRVTTLEKKH